MLCCAFSDIYKANKLIGSFQDIIDNIFYPLFEATIDPASHPDLHRFLQHVKTKILLTFIHCIHSVLCVTLNVRLCLYYGWVSGDWPGFSG